MLDALAFLGSGSARGIDCEPFIRLLFFRRKTPKNGLATNDLPGGAGRR